MMRVKIYEKVITDERERYGRMLLIKVSENLKKQDHQFISIEEFCLYAGIKFDQIQPFTG